MNVVVQLREMLQRFLERQVEVELGPDFACVLLGSPLTDP